MVTVLGPGGPYYGSFATPVMPGSVLITDTFTASAVALRNGQVDTSFALTVTQPSQGCWAVYGTVPIAWIPGDTFSVFVTLHDSTANLYIPVLVDVIIVADPKLAQLVAIAEAKAAAKKSVLDAIEGL